MGFAKKQGLAAHAHEFLASKEGWAELPQSQALGGHADARWRETCLPTVGILKDGLENRSPASPAWQRAAWKQGWLSRFALN